MTQVDALGITAMFAANANFKVFAGCPSFLDREFHQAADAIGVDTGKWIFLEQNNLLLIT